LKKLGKHIIAIIRCSSPEDLKGGLVRIKEKIHLAWGKADYMARDK
jgi:hypothetical protein